MNILALDPASLTGAAHYPSGMVSIWDLRMRPGQHRGITLGLMRDMILYVNAEYGPLDIIAFEDAARASHNYSAKVVIAEVS